MAEQPTAGPDVTSSDAGQPAVTDSTPSPTFRVLNEDLTGDQVYERYRSLEGKMSEQGQELGKYRKEMDLAQPLIEEIRQDPEFRAHLEAYYTGQGKEAPSHINPQTYETNALKQDVADMKLELRMRDFKTGQYGDLLKGAGSDQFLEYAEKTGLKTESGLEAAFKGWVHDKVIDTERKKAAEEAVAKIKEGHGYPPEVSGGTPSEERDITDMTDTQLESERDRAFEEIDRVF